MKIKAFTMLEILMITLIIGIGLLSIVVAISKAKVITNNTKQHIIATQLAREWVEMVYQIRNTNLLKFPDYEDYCWLYTEWDNLCPSIITPTTDRNVWQINPRMTDWINYVLNASKHINWTLETLNISDWISTWEKIFNICLSWGQRISCPWLDNQTKYGKYYRTISINWLYRKNSTITWWVLTHCLFNWQVASFLDWTSTTCAIPTPPWPLEHRFCSRVEYIWTKTWSVEICWVLTNFFED